mgnify:CR=1 FL=1
MFFHKSKLIENLRGLEKLKFDGKKSSNRFWNYLTKLNPTFIKK